MSLAIPAAPIIAPGRAAGLHDRYIDRAVLQWLEALQVEARLSRAALKTFLQSPQGRIGGNAVAQGRWLARVKRLFGERLLCADMRAGNRAKFNLDLDFMQPMSAIRPFDQNQDTSGPPAWLAGIRLNFSRGGANVKSVGEVNFIAALSRHCLIRMVQRCGCESATDLHLAFRAAWPVISKLEALTREAREMRNGDHWRLAVTLPTMTEPAVFVMAGPSAADDPCTFFVKTAFPISFLNARERAEVAELHESLESAAAGSFKHNGMN